MISIVSIADRPDLVPVTGKWRWEAFFKDEMSLDEMLRLEQECASSSDPIPTVIVMFEGEHLRDGFAPSCGSLKQHCQLLKADIYQEAWESIIPWTSN